MRENTHQKNSEYGHFSLSDTESAIRFIALSLTIGNVDILHASDHYTYFF